MSPKLHGWCHLASPPSALARPALLGAAVVRAGSQQPADHGCTGGAARTTTTALSKMYEDMAATNGRQDLCDAGD